MTEYNFWCVIHKWKSLKPTNIRFDIYAISVVATHGRVLLKILVAPFALALSLLAALLVFLFDICAVLLTIASVILTVLGVALFFTPTPIGGIVFLFLAFLLSPYGLQAAAGSLLWALDGGKSALYRFLAS